MRKDVTVLGKFSLNLTNIPQTILKPSNENILETKVNLDEDFAACFFKALSKFVTMVSLINFRFNIQFKINSFNIFYFIYSTKVTFVSIDN
jgi:hypothetical protein